MNKFSMLKCACLVIGIFICSCTNLHKASQLPGTAYHEKYRPQIHFSPKEKWMNDPNGMVFYNGTYHLFYQYYPDSTVWGPMHWGHATSKDLVRWQPQPVALYPDSLGYIFSGSAVVDINNTSGFGKNDIVPLVAIFTNHDPKGERSGTTTFQYQSVAYSLDNGKTWSKYAKNPVLKNPGIKDFRDPKVCWYDEGKKWIMTLATLDRITFYSSPNLKDWTKESEFGKEFGAHGGVWECPDLFPLEFKGQKIWILVINLNPGGPNGGSATQYFTGQFDGNKFIPYQTDTRWLDYGPDEYAGITWSNTGNRKIFLGWMSNWEYATVVPTEKWRSAMTIPRELGIEKVGNKFLVTSSPVKELASLEGKPFTAADVEVSNYDLTGKTGKLSGPCRLTIASDQIEPFDITLSNAVGEKVDIGYDRITNNYFIDRTHSGNVSFEKGFAKKHFAPRLSIKSNMNMTLIIDNSSIELFADDGLTVMTEIFFPGSLLTNINIRSANDFKIRSLTFNSLNSIWR
jgi:fructan beta-fructosidase